MWWLDQNLEQARQKSPENLPKISKALTFWIFPKNITNFCGFFENTCMYHVFFGREETDPTMLSQTFWLCL